MGLERRRCGGCNGVSGSSTVRRETIDLMEVESMWANLKDIIIYFLYPVRA